MNATETPRVWIGSLGAYNAGKLIGRWVDAVDVDELREAASEVQKEAEQALGYEAGDEIMLADREGFGDLIGEYEPLERVAELGALIEEHGAAFVAYAEHVGAEYATADSFEEAFCGEHDSERAYAEELADDLGTEIPDSWPCSHIDWDSAANELFISDYYSVSSPAGVYVFRRI
jgi:antirestriction protein